MEIIRKNPNKELQFSLERNGKELQLPVTPKVQEAEGEKIGIIGVFQPMEKSPIKAISHGAKETYLWTKEIFVMLGKLVTGQLRNGDGQSKCRLYGNACDCHELISTTR